MVPTPQELAAHEQAAPAPDGERVVISGMSGLFPQSNNVKELSDILYNKVNAIRKSPRWKYNHPEVSQYTGNLPGLDRFDAQFFKVHYRLAASMDSMGRKILEQAYQAIYDAGISPDYLNGKKVGVYTGSCFSETEKACFYVASSRTGFGIAGCSKTMFANRISYWLNAKGPSMSLDDACCSSIVALEQAYQDISRGECEAAIVGASNLSLHPQSSVHYGRIMTLCPDGKTKSFDQNADGVAKSEAINVLFLQKAKYAKRVYAEILHVKSGFTEVLKGETGPRYGFYRDPISMVEFLKGFYKEAKVPPEAVEYVEAFGSAVPEADKAELEALGEVFCNDRNDPLLVGSVMSNIGYSEAASGISAITKVILGYQKGEIASNLHCENPRSDVAALREGRMRIVTDHQRFGRAYTAVNGISVTGVNGHVLLHGRYKPKDINRYKSTIPYLVTITARQDSSVNTVINDLKSRPIDPEEIALFHNIHASRISGHLGRGYTILGTNEEHETVSLAETVSYFDDAKRPLWFVYSGMGSQWAGMGSELMRIPIFAAAIERCRKALEPKGVDIIHIITSPDKTIFDNILNSFVGIAAVQIGLTDVLTSLGIVPDMIIGHSVGELGCAYADGCLTAEEMILSAYSRGLVSIETPFIRGSMAAVGIGYTEVSKLVPVEIEVACHNGPGSSTISGPADIMREFVSELTAKGIFAKEVPCSNIAYHSRYIAEAGPGLLKCLTEVIKDPKPRSERWLSTSVPQSQWNEPAAKISSAEYHTNNLLSPVLFDETSRLIPNNAILVEIAPHGLLQAILKRSLPMNCRHIPLTRRGHPDNAFLVLDAIGKLYMEGLHPKLEAIYPKIDFPVSTGTPMLSHLVQWAHQEKWSLPLFVSAHRKLAASTKYLITVHEDEYQYLQGHVVRGKTLYPFSAALVAVWDTLAMSLLVTRKQLSVEFRDVQLLAQPILHDQRNLTISISLHRGTGRFEVRDEDRNVITGYIHGEMCDATRSYETPFETNETLNIKSDEVYKMLYEREYYYRGEFRSIYKVNSSLTEAQIIWSNNWVTFLDGIIQLLTLRCNHDGVSQPHQLRRLCIDVERHSASAEQMDGKTLMTANVLKIGDIIRCGGILVEDAQFRKIILPPQDAVALKALNFVPRFQPDVDATSALQTYLQMVSENINKDSINVLGIVNNDDDLMLFDETRNILDGLYGTKVQYEQLRRDKVVSMRDYFLTEVDLVLVQELSSDDALCQMLYRILPRDMFIINGEEIVEDRVRPSALYRVVSSLNTMHTKLELVKWRPTQATTATTVVTVRSRTDLSLLTATRTDLPAKHRLVILSSYPTIPGLKELVKQWRRESDRNQIYLVMISDKDYLDELPELDLAFNILNNGEWGGEYYTPWQDKVSVERGATLRSSRLGDVGSLHWVEAALPSGPGVTVNVHYAAINDIDAKRATGVIKFKDGNELSYGMDYSGVTDSGERVMGVLPCGAVSGRVRAVPELSWPVPEHWSLEDAATVPSAYLLALYCFGLKIELRRGLKVLVHGGAGALGQASIAICLANGCEVFTTVSDVRKKRFLMKLFPDLKEDHIGNSRDTSFEEMVMVKTSTQGYNVALCCVSGDLIDATLRCSGASGILLDVGLINSRDKYALGMKNLTFDRNYMALDVSSLFTHHDTKNMKKLQMLISEGILRGYVRPLSRVTYAPHEAPRAFRLLAARRHRGRVVLRLRDARPRATPRLSCSPDLCHVVVCGDTLGLQLAGRLVARGATQLLVHCHTVTNHLRFKMQLWEKLGVHVKVLSDDLTSKGVVALLTEGNRMGPVEGIYVDATNVPDEAIDKVNTLVANLDAASRKLCPSIRYFAIFNVGVTIGRQTCCYRVREGLPATVLNLPTLRQYDDVDESPVSAGVSWRAAVDTAELALRSSQPVLLAHRQAVPETTLLHEITRIADINVTEETGDDVTLLELGMEPAKGPIVASYLCDTHHVAMTETNIASLTVHQIRQLEETLRGAVYQDVRGLEAFFTYVDPDELMATTEIAYLSTLTNSTTSRDDEIDVAKTYLCIVPGLDGHHRRFEAFCERLKVPALVVQPGLDHLHETIRETANRFADHLMKKIKLKNNFYLLGYESGVVVALEMAAILEKLGLTGTVFCVGGTPEEIQAAIETQLREYDTDEALQDAVAHHMLSLMTANTEELDTVLKNASSWKEKVETGVRMILGRVAHSVQYARALLEAAYTFVQQARTYKTDVQQLRSRLILLHAASVGIGKSPEILLQRYSQQPVVVHELKAPLAHAIKDLRCSAIVNRHLDDEILHEFKHKNLCETYLLNADVFMTSAEEVEKDLIAEE